MKNLSSVMRHNPLISLDSDERIQGNPRQSNAYKRGLFSQTDRVQENPNEAVRPNAAPAAEAEPATEESTEPEANTQEAENDGGS